MKNFLWKLYAFKFLDSFILIGAIFTLLFQSNGLSTTQISLLITIWSLTTLILEVPTGVLADKYSRKYLLIIARLIQAVGFGFWLLGGFINYAIGFFLWGIKNTLTSGTMEAFIYDELKSFNKESLYEKVNGKASSAFFFGLMLSTILGGIVAQTSFSLAIIASILGSILAALILLTVKPAKAIESTGESKYFEVLKQAISHIKSNHSLLHTILFISITFSVYGAADEFWPLLYSNYSLDVKIVGILVAVGFGLFSLAGYTVHWFNSQKYKFLDKLLLILSGLLFILAGLTKSAFYLIPVVFTAIYLIQVASLKYEAKLQHQIKANQRATISSIKSLVFELIYMLFVLGFGIISDISGTISIVIVMGSLILLMGLKSKTNTII